MAYPQFIAALLCGLQGVVRGLKGVLGGLKVIVGLLRDLKGLLRALKGHLRDIKGVLCGLMGVVRVACLVLLLLDFEFAHSPLRRLCVCMRKCMYAP